MVIQRYLPFLCDGVENFELVIGLEFSWFLFFVVLVFFRRSMEMEKTTNHLSILLFILGLFKYSNIMSINYYCKIKYFENYNLMV